MAKAPVATAEKDQLPATVEETGYEAYAGQGFEDHSKDDYSVPFLVILQGLSPQMETVEGAKLGAVCNSVTNDLYKEGVVFVPCATHHCFVEWLPRAKGGGFVAQHELDADVVVHCKEKQEFGSYTTPAGNDLVETFYVYGVLVTDEGGNQAAIAFSGTKIKPYKAWMTKARAIQIAIKNASGTVIKRITPPLFAHRYKLTTIKQKNTKGEYYNWSAAFDGTDAVVARIDPKSELFESCVAVANMVKEGSVKLDMKGQEQPDSGGGPSNRTADEDAPF